MSETTPATPHLTDDGTATEILSIPGRVAPGPGRPGASVVLDVPGAKIVAFEFAAGQDLHEHAAAHPVVIQVLRGRAELTVQGRTVTLTPGDALHLTARLRHSVHAADDTTLTVTMLLDSSTAPGGAS